MAEGLEQLQEVLTPGKVTNIHIILNKDRNIVLSLILLFGPDNKFQTGKLLFLYGVSNVVSSNVNLSVISQDTDVPTGVALQRWAGLWRQALGLLLAATTRAHFLLQPCFGFCK